MAAFFPPPNLLLLDHPDQEEQKQSWTRRMDFFLNNCRPKVRDVISSQLRDIPSFTKIDLYETMKTLSWKILLSLFVPDESSSESKIESLQEDLLRGQFSLFPVSIDAKFWRSTRSRGLDARKRLQTILASKVAGKTGACPFTTSTAEAEKDVASHLLLFTSSLAVKSFTSLLTALIMNLYLFKANEADQGPSVASQIAKNIEPAHRRGILQKILRETERLSPPVIGIMRRTKSDIVLNPAKSSGSSTASPILIPKGWDLWLYFVGAARDPATFGSQAEKFQMPDVSEAQDSARDIGKEGLAFGAGPKSCLGKDLMRELAIIVAEVCIGGGVTPDYNFVGEDTTIPNGVKGWLGWKENVTPEEWAGDMKQLPTQRPLKPIRVLLNHTRSERLK